MALYPDIITSSNNSVARKLKELATSSQGGLIIDPTYIANIREQGFYAARDLIADALEVVFSDLHKITSKQVTGYYIGYTHLKEATPTIDLMTQSNIQVLQRQWECHKDTWYGQDGLVVLASVSQEVMPPSRRGYLTAKQYTIALCQQVLHLMKIVNGDSRLANIDCSDDQDEKNTDTYVIYLILTLS